MDQSEIAAVNEFLKRISGLTVHVVGCNEKDWPTQGWASGLLWERGNTLTLLSVAHNFKKGPRRLDTRMPGSGGSLLIEIPEPGWMSTANINQAKGTIEQAHDIDFAWVNYDLAKLRAKLQANPHGIAIPPFPAIRTPPTRIPEAGRAYGFSASIAAGYHPRSRELQMRNAYEVFMEYDGVQSDGDCAGCYRFKLARPHQGDDYYQGSSGAPIADDEGHIVALVAAGDVNKGIIFGTPLQPFVKYLDL